MAEPSPLFDAWLAGYDCGHEDALAGRRRPLTRTELGLSNVIDMQDYRDDNQHEKEAR